LCAIIAKDNRIDRNYGIWLTPQGGLHLSYVNGGNTFLESPGGLIPTNTMSFVVGIIDQPTAACVCT